MSTHDTQYSLTFGQEMVQYFIEFLDHNYIKIHPMAASILKQNTVSNLSCMNKCAPCSNSYNESHQANLQSHPTLFIL